MVLTLPDFYYNSVLPTGFEPATVRLGGECSSLELQEQSTERQESNLTRRELPYLHPNLYCGLEPRPDHQSAGIEPAYLPISVQAFPRAHDHFRRTQTRNTTTVLFRHAEGRFQIHLMTGRLRLHQPSSL